MAHLKRHGTIIEVWKRPTSDNRYHLNHTGIILLTTGPRKGGAKVVMGKNEKGNRVFAKKSLVEFREWAARRGYVQESTTDEGTVLDKNWGVYEGKKLV